MTRLEDIAARLEAATPGPWRVYGANYIDAGPNTNLIANGSVPALGDAELIAHAPADLAALLAVVREVAALADSLETPSVPVSAADRLVLNIVARKIRVALNRLEA